MPAGSKRPDTKEKRLQTSFNKANKDFKQNRAALDANSKVMPNPVTGIDSIVRAYKDSGKMKKRDAAKKALDASPTGVKSRTVYSKHGFDKSGLDWRELSKKNGVYKTK